MRREKSTIEPSEAQVPPEPSQAAPVTSDPIGLRYAGDGDLSFGMVPRRDLTVREVCDLEPAQINTITAPNPGSGVQLYQWTDDGKAAWDALHPNVTGDEGNADG